MENPHEEGSDLYGGLDFKVGATTKRRKAYYGTVIHKLATQLPSNRRILEAQRDEFVREEEIFFQKMEAELDHVLGQVSEDDSLLCLFDLDETIVNFYCEKSGRLRAVLRPSLVALLKTRIDELVIENKIELGIITIRTKDELGVVAAQGDLDPFVSYLSKDHVYTMRQIDYHSSFTNHTQTEKRLRERFKQDGEIILQKNLEKLFLFQGIRDRNPGRVILVVDDLYYPAVINDEETRGASLFNGGKFNLRLSDR